MDINTLKLIIITVLCLYALIKGAELLMQGAVAIAEKFKISKLIIASTLIAIGTGLPTIAVNVAMILLSESGADIALGNAVGTNFVNIGLALGIPAILTTIKPQFEVFEKEIPIYLAITALYTSFALDGIFTRFEGIFILLSYVITLYIVYQYARREKKEVSLEQNSQGLDLDTSTINETKTELISMSKAVVLILIGFVMLTAFSIWLAIIAPALATGIGISEYVLGLTIIGIGTSLPTIVTSVRAAKKGYIDIILGNVFGGTIGNIALGMGLPALFRNLPFSAEVIADTYFFNLFNMIMMLGILIEMKVLRKGNKALNMVSGIIIVTVYLIYLISKLV